VGQSHALQRARVHDAVLRVRALLHRERAGGKKPFVRRIPGIDAIEEAIGRATEMGRPVLYVPGINDIDDIQTVASLVILENVAKVTARYETPIRVPVTYPDPIHDRRGDGEERLPARGRADQYDPDSVRFISPEQFAYVAAVTASCCATAAAHIFMGAFFAESLLLARRASETGAIQVAGTANVHQLPFFVVACDYTLIGEGAVRRERVPLGEPSSSAASRARPHQGRHHRRHHRAACSSP
jgi:hypothetical protein